MKIVPKSTLDSFIFIAKLRWEEDEDYKELSNQLDSFAIVLERRTGVHWLVWIDLINAIFGASGLNTHADNETVYEILQKLGWEVKEVKDEIRNSRRNKR